MEKMPEDASVNIRVIDDTWLVRVVGGGEVIEKSFEDEQEAEDFALAHRTRLGLKVQPDVS